MTPQEVMSAWTARLPQEIFIAVNELLVKKWKGINNPITIKQEEIIESLSLGRDKIFENHWLDFEPFYEKNGWKVEYTKPFLGETFEPYFTFEPKKQ